MKGFSGCSETKTKQTMILRHQSDILRQNSMPAVLKKIAVLVTSAELWSSSLCCICYCKIPTPFMPKFST